MSLEFADYNSVTVYGADLQNMIAELTHRMLKSMQETETDNVVDVVHQTVSILSEKEEPKKTRFFLFGRAGKEGFYQKQQKKNEMLRRVEQLEKVLEERRTKLLMDSSLYETMYQMNQTYQHEVEKLIQDAKVTIAEWKSPEKQASSDEVLLHNNMLVQLEQRVEELSLSKTLLGQQAAQIRILQENASAVAREIQSTLYSVIPLWRNQMTLKEKEMQQKELQQKELQNRKMYSNESLENNSLQKDTQLLSDEHIGLDGCAENMDDNKHDASDEHIIRQNLIDSLGKLVDVLNTEK